MERHLAPLLWASSSTSISLKVELKLEIVNGLDPKANLGWLLIQTGWKMLVEKLRAAWSKRGRREDPPGEISNASTPASPRPGSQRLQDRTRHLHFTELFV